MRIFTFKPTVFVGPLYGTPQVPYSEALTVLSHLAVITFLFLVSGLQSGAQTIVPTNYPPAFDCPWQITPFERAAQVSQQRTFDIAFEPNGTVWLATSDGLRRYDGYTWKRFGTNNGLPSAFTRAILISDKNEIWVGTDAGVGVFDYRTGKFTPRISPQLPADSTVRRIAQDPDGTLWFCSDCWPDPSFRSAGLVSLSNNRWRSYGLSNGLLSDYLLNYFRSSSGRRYAITLSGTSVLDGDHWTPLGNADPGAGPQLLMMAESKKGELFFQQEKRLWLLNNGQWSLIPSQSVLVGTTRDGTPIAVERDETQTSIWMSLWNGSRFVRASSQFPYHPGARLYKVTQAPDGSIWCIGQSTLIRWDFKAGQWQMHRELPSPQFTDKAGRVWFFNQSNVVFHTNGRFYTVPDLSNVTAVDDRNRAWGSARSGTGLLSVAMDTGLVQRSDCGVSEITFCSSDSNGILWVVGKDRNGLLAVSHHETNGWRLLDVPELRPLNSGSFSDGKDGTFWMVSHIAGTIDFELAHVTPNGIERQPNNAPLPVIYPGFAIAAGCQWLSGYKALFCKPFGSNSWQMMKPFADARLNDVLPAGDEVFFMMGGNDGQEPACALFYNNTWKSENGAFTKGMCAQDGKTLFMLSRGGVYIRRTPGTLTFDHLQFPFDAFANQVVQDADNSLWISTSEGVLHYTPWKVPPASTIATTAETRKNGSLPVSFGGIRRFDPTDRPGSFRYSWRFDDGSWSSFQKEAETNLPVSHLSVGTHTLQVRARDADGNIDPSPPIATFLLKPVPLQEHRWFYPSVLAVFALLTYLLWLGILRTNQIHKANTALREEISVRRQTEAQLQQARSDLELRVSERTAELSTANKSLSREIAERRQVEEMRARLEEQLRHVQKMQAIGTLAGGIAHDFNNILAAIIPYTHLVLEQTADKPEVQDDLNQILLASERARLLVQQILTFSGQQRQERKIVDLSQVVEEGLKLLRSVLPENVKLVKNSHSPLPPVFADAGQLHQVLVNLCTNAAHAIHGRQGLITIDLEAVEIQAGQFIQPDTSLEAGTYVRLSVRDNGSGMSSAVLNRAFEPFFTTKPLGEGSGMGLAVVHGIIADHSGSVRLNSQPDQGTTVEVFLPAYRKSLVDSLPPFPAPLGRGQRILLVDDEPALCAVLGHLIVHLGYQVATFTRPTMALEAFEASPQNYDLLLTDLSMPEMSGAELAAKLHAIQPSLPVIVMTGYGHNANLENTGAELSARILCKPIEPNALRDMIYQALRQP